MADKTADNTTTAGGRDAGPTAPASGKGPDRTAVTQPQLGFIGMCRWAWRQLTTMRVALILLLVLALASIPGSL
ncbi:cytochrome C biogenesis protein ResB, partial [Mycobacterium tuberculosis]|nr:cytochrome C biogenesis protein ResB [Mycobacterium tuberculosis]